MLGDPQKRLLSRMNAIADREIDLVEAKQHAINIEIDKSGLFHIRRIHAPNTFQKVAQCFNSL